MLVHAQARGKGANLMAFSTLTVVKVIVVPKSDGVVRLSCLIKSLQHFDLCHALSGAASPIWQEQVPGLLEEVTKIGRRGFS